MMKRLLFAAALCLLLASCSTLPKVAPATFPTRAARLAIDPCRSCAADTLRQLLAAAPDASTFQECLDWCERHYGEPTNEEHNEQLYVAALQAAVDSRFLSDNDKLRYSMLLDDAMKNPIGNTAADFSFVTPDGTTSHLNDFATPLTLIYFNDPDCDACELVKARLDSCQTLREMTLRGKLSVIAIYPFADSDLWHRTPYPNYIVNGWNKAQDVDGTLYALPQLPVFYLLDFDKKVLIKNEPSLNRILAAVEEYRKLFLAKKLHFN